MAVIFLAFLGIVGFADASGHQSGSGALVVDSFLKPVEYSHTLRVCNAYAGDESFSVEIGGINSMMGAPIKYKECQQLNLVKPLVRGDRLDFRTEKLPIGTFAIDSLPRYDAVMYVVIHRSNSELDPVSFQSHMFATSKDAQVAVLDTYAGDAKAALLLANSTGHWEGTILPFGTAFGVPQGAYQIILSDGSADSKIRVRFTAARGESYLVLRTGRGKVGNSTSTEYPQDLLVYPTTEDDVLDQKSGAHHSFASLIVPALALVSFRF
eukprot:s1185_g2.t1